MRYTARSLNVADVKRRVSPLDFYAGEVMELPQRKRLYGWVIGGLCPFHADRRVGSFYINLDSGAFNCFSCGASGGDVIDFVRSRHGFTFPEALQYLAGDWGAPT